MAGARRGVIAVGIAVACLLCATNAGAAPQAIPSNHFGKPPTSHVRRNTALLETIKRDHPLVLRGAELPDPPVVRMRRDDGYNETCSFTKETLSRRREALMQRAQAEAEETPDTYSQALSPLRGVCAELNEGWWTYQWCHRREVRQFHREAGGEMGQNWSLGQFSEKLSPDQEIEGNAVHAHQFVGGQHCDETGKGRSTEVKFFCCDAPGSGIAAIQSVTEPFVCQYTIVVCSLFSCVDESVDAKPPSFKKLLQPLHGHCFQTGENWWNYEFCFGHYLRQYHKETIAQEDGSSKTAVTAQFMLGRNVVQPPPAFLGPQAQAEAIDYNSQAAVKLAAQFNDVDTVGARTLIPFVTLHAKADPRRSYLQMQLFNGSECDLADKNRTADVKVLCYHGPDIAGMHAHQHTLESISEVSTCHYEVVLRTTAVCSHPAFKVNALPDLTVDCVPEGEEAGKPEGPKQGSAKFARASSNEARTTSKSAASNGEAGAATSVLHADVLEEKAKRSKKQDAQAKLQLQKQADAAASKRRYEQKLRQQQAEAEAANQARLKKMQAIEAKQEEVRKKREQQQVHADEGMIQMQSPKIAPLDREQPTRKARGDAEARKRRAKKGAQASKGKGAQASKGKGAKASKGKGANASKGKGGGVDESMEVRADGSTSGPKPFSQEQLTAMAERHQEMQRRAEEAEDEES